MLADGDGGGVLVDNVLDGVGQNGGQNDTNAQSQYDPEGDGITLQLLLLFCFLALPLGHIGHSLFLADLFLIGCTHVINSSRISPYGLAKVYVYA